MPAPPAVLITTYNVYRNIKWLYGCWEHNPLSVSHSWWSRICGLAPHQAPHLHLAGTRAGNLMQCAPWRKDPPIGVCNPRATHPRQPVLTIPAPWPPPSTSDPGWGASRRVRKLVGKFLRYRHGSWLDERVPSAPMRQTCSTRVIDTAHRELAWAPHWPFSTPIKRILFWYLQVHQAGVQALAHCRNDLNLYLTSLPL